MTASSKRNHKEKPIRRKEEKPEEPELRKYRDRAKERREDQNPDYEQSELGFHVVAPPGSVDILSSDAHKLSIEKSKYLGGEMKTQKKQWCSEFVSKETQPKSHAADALRIKH